MGTIIERATELALAESRIGLGSLQTLCDAHREQKEETVLLLARKAGQSVVIDGNIRVTVDRIRGRVVRLRIEAPAEIRVDREEVWNRRASEIQPDRTTVL